MRTTLGALAAAAALSSGLSRPLAAQVEVVRGVVYDSLAGAPLANAFITAVGEEATAVTDSLGRFELRSRQRLTRVIAYHEVLDRLGLGALALERDAQGRWHAPGDAGRPSETAWLATPSIETVWRRLCRGRRPADGHGGILIGSTRRAHDGTRLAGAQVVVQWESVRGQSRRARDTMPVYASLAVASDSSGEYTACGVQEFGQAGVAAAGHAYRSGNVLVRGDVRPLRRQDLVLADTAVRTTLSGTVVDDAGAPVADATVTLDGADQAALTRADGSFRIAQAPAGTRMLATRKVGFLPSLDTVTVFDDAARDVAVTLERGITLDAVKVTARRAVSWDRAEFDERRRAGFSQVMDSTRLMQFPMLQSALRMYPTLHVLTGRSGFEFSLLGRVKSGGARCRVIIWVDGVLSDTEFLRILPLENIAATELFSSDAFAPARYRSFGDYCATLLVWTKAFLNR